MRQTPIEDEISEEQLEAIEGTRLETEPTVEDLTALKSERIENIDDDISMAIKKPNEVLEQAASSMGLSEEELGKMESGLSVKMELEETNAEIARLGENYKGKIVDVDTGTETRSEDTVESPEITPEKQEIMDRAGEQRAGLFKRVAYKILDVGSDIAPIISGGKEIYKGVKGESNGEKLTTKERIVHGALGAAYIALDLVGIGEGREAAVAAGKGIVAVEKLAVYAAKKGKNKLANIFTKTAEFMANNPAITAKVEAQIDKHINRQIKNLRNYGSQYAGQQEGVA